MREKVAAGYAQATLKFGRLTVLPGIRVEHTSDDTGAKLVNAAVTAFAKTIKTDAAYAAALASPYNSFNALANNSYTDVFPGLNVKFDAGRGAGVARRGDHLDRAPELFRSGALHHGGRHDRRGHDRDRRKRLSEALQGGQSR